MKAQQSTLEFLGQAMKLPFYLFADSDETRVFDRFDELHRQLPDSLPEKRLFRH